MSKETNPGSIVATELDVGKEICSTSVESEKCSGRLSRHKEMPIFEILGYLDLCLSVSENSRDIVTKKPTEPFSARSHREGRIR